MLIMVICQVEIIGEVLLELLRITPVYDLAGLKQFEIYLTYSGHERCSLYVDKSDL